MGIRFSLPQQFCILIKRQSVKKHAINIASQQQCLDRKRKQNEVLETIQEKIAWIKKNDSSPLKTECADKIRVHEYVKEKLGEDICVPILKIYNSSDEINPDELPDQFVLKCNHGYNMNIICTDKSSFDFESAKKNLNSWQHKNFGKTSGQFQYSGITPKIFAETYMSDENQKSSLFDYKFWCFNGVPRMYTINDGHGHGDIMYYDMSGNPIDLYGLGIKNSSYKRPSNFDLMVEYAKRLSSEFKFVRVDFYEVEGKVYLGELTFTPGNGQFKYKSKELDRMVGTMLDVWAKKDGKYKDGISVCITAYKSKQFIKETLDSIENQTWFKYHDNYEIILGIDGCQETLDYVKTIMNRYRNLRVLMMKENKGTYITSNTIMSEAEYNWLLRFDSDDVMLPDMIEKLMNARFNYDLISFRMKNFGNSNVAQQAWGQHLIKHEIFDEFGGYMPWICSADANFITRLKPFVKTLTMRDIMFCRRVHTSNLTVAKDTSYRSDIRAKYNSITLKWDLSKRSKAYINKVVSEFVDVYNSTDKQILKQEPFDFSKYIKIAYGSSTQPNTKNITAQPAPVYKRVSYNGNVPSVIKDAVKIKSLV